MPRIWPLAVACSALLVGCGSGARSSGSAHGEEHTPAEYRYREQAIEYCQRASGATQAECEETAERKFNGEWKP